MCSNLFHLNQICRWFLRVSSQQTPGASDCSIRRISVLHLHPFSNYSQQSTVACDILSLCLTSLSLDQEPEKNSNVGALVLVDEMVRHPNENVKIIGLTQLERLVKRHPDHRQSPETIVDVIKCLDLANTTVGTLAMKILETQLPQYFDSTDVRNAIDTLTSTSNSTTKCRVYEVIVHMARTSVQNLRRTAYLVDRIIVDISSDDVLLQLNIMEILSDLVTVDYGLAYLEEQGLFPRLMATLENIDMMMNILFPGFIKFFGSVANAHPDQIFAKYGYICKPLFETIINNDSSTLSSCLETLGVLGRSKMGKIGLSDLHLVCPEGDMKMVLMEMAMFLTTLPTEEQIRILNCVELLLRFEAEGDEAEMGPDNRISTITEKWYKYLDRGPGLKTVLSYCRNPFADIKLAGFGVLKSVVEYTWGRAAIANTAGFLEYVLDRGADVNTEAFQAKFDVLQCLNKHNESFSEAQKTDIRDYVARGPFYKKGITEVAVAEDGH